jgi:hypothetical protein
MKIEKLNYHVVAEYDIDKVLQKQMFDILQDKINEIIDHLHTEQPSLQINCDKCGKPITEPGALLFSPPNNGVCLKTHICKECYEQPSQEERCPLCKAKYVCINCGIDKPAPLSHDIRFKLLKHNSIDQMNWGGNDDTRQYLKEGEIYAGRKEVHSQHTKIFIDGRPFNSVCFEEVSSHDKRLEEIKEVLWENSGYTPNLTQAGVDQFSKAILTHLEGR